MKSIEIEHSLAELEAFLRRPWPAEEAVLLTKGGAPYALLLPPEVHGYLGADAETRAVRDSPVFQAIIEAGRRQRAEGLGIPAEALHRELGITESHMKAARSRKKMPALGAAGDAGDHPAT